MFWWVLFQQMFFFGWTISLTVDVNVFKEWFSEAALSPSFPLESRCQVGAWQWYLKDWSHSLKGRSLESWGAGHHYRIKYFCEWDCSVTCVCAGSCTYLWISITSSAIMRPILPAPALVPPGIPGTIWRGRFPPPVRNIHKCKKSTERDL